jgi:hypothetical protein
MLRSTQVELVYGTASGVSEGRKALRFNWNGGYLAQGLGSKVMLLVAACSQPGTFAIGLTITTTTIFQEPGKVSVLDMAGGGSQVQGLGLGLKALRVILPNAA